MKYSHVLSFREQIAIEEENEQNQPSLRSQYKSQDSSATNENSNIINDKSTEVVREKEKTSEDANNDFGAEIRVLKKLKLPKIRKLLDAKSIPAKEVERRVVSIVAKPDKKTSTKSNIIIRPSTTTTIGTTSTTTASPLSKRPHRVVNIFSKKSHAFPKSKNSDKKKTSPEISLPVPKQNKPTISDKPTESPKKSKSKKVPTFFDRNALKEKLRSVVLTAINEQKTGSIQDKVSFILSTYV